MVKDVSFSSSNLKKRQKDENISIENRIMYWGIAEYRVENRILPVVFYLDSYCVLGDIELIFCTEPLQTFI